MGVMAFALCMAAGPVTAVAQDRVEVEPLRGVVHLFRAHHGERFTNQVVSAGPDGLLMVDMRGDWRTMQPYANLLALVRDSMARLDERPLRLLVNTHWHGDHTAGNAVFGGAAVIVAHENVRARLAESQLPWWFPESLPALAQAGWPVVTFRDSLTLHFNGEAIHLWNFGLAHTDGDAVVFFEMSRVVHMGDLFHGLSQPSMGGDMVGLARTLEETLARIPPDTRVVTGHGPVTDVPELQRYHDLLAGTLTWMAAQVGRETAWAAIESAGRARLVETGWSTETIDQWLGSIHRTVTGDIRPNS